MLENIKSGKKCSLKYLGNMGHNEKTKCKTNTNRGKKEKEKEKLKQRNKSPQIKGTENIYKIT